MRKKYFYYGSHLLWLSGMVSAIAAPPCCPADKKEPIAVLFKAAVITALDQYHSIWHCGPYPKMNPFPYHQEMKNLPQDHQHDNAAASATE